MNIQKIRNRIRGSLTENKKSKPVDSFTQLKEWIESYDVDNIFEAVPGNDPYDARTITSHTDRFIKDLSKSAARDLRYFEKLASRITQKPTKGTDLQRNFDFVFTNIYHLLDEQITAGDLINDLVLKGFKRWDRINDTYRKEYNDGGYEQISLDVNVHADDNGIVEEIKVTGLIDRG